MYPGLEILAETMVAKAKVAPQFLLSPSTAVYRGITIGVLFPRDVSGAFSGDVFEWKRLPPGPPCLIQNNHLGVRLCQVTLKFGAPCPRVR